MPWSRSDRFWILTRSVTWWSPESRIDAKWSTSPRSSKNDGQRIPQARPSGIPLPSDLETTPTFCEPVTAFFRHVRSKKKQKTTFCFGYAVLDSRPVQSLESFLVDVFCNRSRLRDININMEFLGQSSHKVSLSLPC
jgi:hypothetical protein